MKEKFKQAKSLFTSVADKAIKQTKDAAAKLEDSGCLSKLNSVAGQALKQSKEAATQLEGSGCVSKLKGLLGGVQAKLSKKKDQKATDKTGE